MLLSLLWIAFFMVHTCPSVTSVLLEIIWNCSISTCWIFPHTNYDHMLLLYWMCPVIYSQSIIYLPSRIEKQHTPSKVHVNSLSQQSSGDAITVRWFSDSRPRHCTSVSFLPPQRSTASTCQHTYMYSHSHVRDGDLHSQTSPHVAGENMNTMQQKFTSDSLPFPSHTHNYKAMRLQAPHESASCLTA